ncbi:hypothetical protein OOU_Y34scaffold00267g17 [Pyricularia oryzae Y34]|uniref:Uncharacterized protein n=2 Tax=Pyricularia oryzae TaxID=318829 RepID=A0AA97P431_PYRO3|nr:hypothetical protein OOU_Y34scaffold00267g17 [Pyricularia oryzae Y34]
MRLMQQSAKTRLDLDERRPATLWSADIGTNGERDRLSDD